MSKKKKILLGLGGICLVALIPIVMYVGQLYSAIAPFITTAPNHVVEDYVEGKYGFKVNVIDKQSYGIGSSTEFKVEKEDEEHIWFTVTVDPEDYTIIEDDYKLALTIDKEYEKLKTVIPEIESLGFKGMDGAPIRLDYIQDSAYLNLQSDKPINYETFVEEDFDTYYELYKLVKKSRANIENVTAFGTLVKTSDPNDTGDQNDIGIYLESPEKERTREELLHEIKAGYPVISEKEVQNRLANEAKQLTNERFHLGNQYDDTHNDPFDSWLNCDITNEQGVCTSAVLSVTYQKGGLNADNPHLSEDLSTLFAFIETHLEPKIKVNHIFLAGDEFSAYEEVDISHEERMKHRDVDALIKAIFKTDK